MENVENNQNQNIDKIKQLENQQKTSVGVEAVMNGDAKINKPQAERTKNVWYIICAIIVVVGVVAGIAFAVQNLTNNTGDAGQQETTSDADSSDNGDAGAGAQIMSTELSSGTVTTTIGGKSITYNAAYVVDGVDVTISGGTFESTTDDQVTFLVINGGSLTIEGDVLVDKTGSSDFAGRGDNYSFYGTNSAIAVVGEGSTVNINGAAITTSVSGANAVVATNGGEAVVQNTTINTTKDNSRGLHATYGGVINANNTKIATQGGSCAALATDRGAGIVIASNMTLSTAGAGSPLIYSTGDISVTDSTGTATGAQIAVVEGKNSVTLKGCEFSANGIGNRNNVDNAAVMIYQSMSGDASVGTGSFTASDCTLNVLDSSSVYDSTPFFFITNTDATISLTNVVANFSSDEKFISAVGTSEWGRSGSNGADVNVTLTNVTATNTAVETDSISSVTGL
ncbi:hypothetical protein IJJ39_02630 [Candidatus Saccharibacteria bacterium]|nr:hypothetical protein [Candidatus Saccharibacteria bacterium]